MTAKTRATKGGEWVQGVFYKGGQFLPTETPQFGKFNQKGSTKKVRKIQIEPFVWVEERENMRPIFSIIGGTCATIYKNIATYNLSGATEVQVLNYIGKSKAEAIALCDLYNSGERWITR